MAILDKFLPNARRRKSKYTPIATDFAGVTFRSKLEARWAVLLDSMGIEWRYEPYTLKQGSLRYLPDFMLYNVDFLPHFLGLRLARTSSYDPIYLEVKHHDYKPTRQDGEKWGVARRQTKNFMVAYGLGFADGTSLYSPDTAMTLLTYNSSLQPEPGRLSVYTCAFGHIWVEFNEIPEFTACPRCRLEGHTHGFNQAYTVAADYFRD